MCALACRAGRSFRGEFADSSAYPQKRISDPVDRERARKAVETGI